MSVDSGKKLVVETSMSGEGSNKPAFLIPDGAATMTNMKALASMSGLGKLGLQIDGVNYALPVLLDA